MEPSQRSKLIRYLCGAVAVVGLAAVYLFQYTDFLYLISGKNFSAEYHFIVNRLTRILVNDTCMLILIYALFMDRQILKLTVAIELIDVLVLFPIYLSLKLPSEGVAEISSPLLSQFHRLIVNPTLMILLIPAIYYQRITRIKEKSDD
jgi:exosortase F-associated protein